MSLRPLLITSLMPLVLAACAGTPTSPPDATSPSPLMAQDIWTLNAATAKDGAVLLPGDTGYQLQFTADRVSITGGCNRMAGGYTMAGGKLQVGALAATRMACPEPRMQQDATLARLLTQPLTVSLLESDPEQLRLQTSAGEVLMFTGAPSAESRYGGPGETVFLEVAAQTQPCHHPLMPAMQCLQVRELTYDDRGIRTSAGEFQPFYDSIEGYEHQPGVRNVLRVKRYTVPNPPADASNRAWVLDLVVESETVKP